MIKGIFLAAAVFPIIGQEEESEKKSEVRREDNKFYPMLPSLIYFRRHTHTRFFIALSYYVSEANG